jgi:hypothetical protein
MKTKMKTVAIVLTILLSSTLMYGQVKSDFDKTVDFTTYKTYTFKGWAKDSDKQLNDLDKKRVEDAFKNEFDKRGLKMDNNNPDLAVTLFIVIQKKTSTTAYTDYTGGFGYGARWGWGMGAGVGMGSATTTYNEDDYNEGTLVIDFYDAEKKNMIYQGTLTTIVNDKPQKREKSIPKNIAKLMKKYPVKPVK